MSTNLRIIKKAKPYLNPNLLTSVYNSMVKPHFDYCCVVWDSIDKTLADQLQKLQNRAARIITGAPYTIHTQDVFAKLGWPSLEHNRKCQKAQMMHKIINSNAPKYLTQIIKNHCGSNNYNLRSSSRNIEIPSVRTEYYKRSFAVPGLLLWNSLPNSLKEETNFSTFKHKIKTHDFCTGNI